MNQLVERARIFATAAHSAVGQKRKYTGRPYIEHPAAVVKILEGIDATPEMLAAAWLHDVCEDTQVEPDLLKELFGEDVESIVYCWLTEPKVEGQNRAWRKANYRDILSRAPAAAQTIKLADLIDNTDSIVARDPKFALVYLAEKEDLLEVLTQGDPRLLEKARAQVKEARGRLGSSSAPKAELRPGTCPHCGGTGQPGGNKGGPELGECSFCEGTGLIGGSRPKVGASKVDAPKADPATQIWESVLKGLEEVAEAVIVNDDGSLITINLGPLGFWSASPSDLGHPVFKAWGEKRDAALAAARALPLSGWMDQCLNRIEVIYGSVGRDLPTPAALSRRLLEEAVELHLTVGGTPETALLAVTDALANEAKKCGTVPSEMADFAEVLTEAAPASEIFDVRIIAALIARVTSTTEVDLRSNGLAKVARLEAARREGRLHFTEDGRFYRRGGA